VREFEAKGYAANEHDAVTSTTATWLVSGQAIQIVLAQPARARTTPVVIYLPGLGESSEAGAHWRATWAAAGYGVLSVQPLDDDAGAWRSDLARGGEFKTLGQQRFAGTEMSRRVQLLADVVAEAQRRSTADAAPWQLLDWNNVAIAGFDLGAYTAMTVAGEHVRDAEDAPGRVRVRAAIALSPYATIAAGSLDTRYRDIHVPVMSVTGDADLDVLGLVEGADLRDAPFTHMPGPQAYLLSLHGLPHPALSGTDANGLMASADSTNRSQDSVGTASGDEGSPQRRGSKRVGTGDGRRRQDRFAAAGLSPTALQMRVVAVQGVSTAFLDAHLKDDPRAREWLVSDARRWLGTMGDLRRK
jgi:predicted dienelactone hydrolase